MSVERHFRFDSITSFFSFFSAIVASAIKAIDLIEKDSSLPGRVLANAKYFRDEMQGLGFKVQKIICVNIYSFYSFRFSVINIRFVL